MVVQTTDEPQTSLIQVETSIPYPELMTNYRLGHLICFMIVPLLAGVANGYALCYTNNASKILAAKYDLQSNDSKSLNESIIGSSVVLGCCFGAAAGGKII